MGLFSSKPMDPKDSTIPDADWRSLQDRARKANPHWADVCSDEGTARRKAAAEQYEKRNQS